MVTDSDRGTQYQGAHNLSVIPGASFTYQIDWAALRAGENGVTMKVDNDSDGNIEYHERVGALLSNDVIAPTTTAYLPDSQRSDGSYPPGVTVTLMATDNEGGIGVDKTEYSLDNGITWATYTGPLFLSTQGENTVLYRSRDGFGNYEINKFLTFTVRSQS